MTMHQQVTALLSGIIGLAAPVLVWILWGSFKLAYVTLGIQIAASAVVLLVSIVCCRVFGNREEASQEIQFDNGFSYLGRCVLNALVVAPAASALFALLALLSVIH